MSLEILRKAYFAETGSREMPEIKTLHGGKPVFAEGDLHFSVSHSKGFLLVALGNNDIGADCELIRPLRGDVSAYTLTDSEKAQIMASSDPDRLFMKFWTYKEAYVKLTGEGFSEKFKQVGEEYAKRKYPGLQSIQLEKQGCMITVLQSRESPWELKEFTME